MGRIMSGDPPKNLGIRPPKISAEPGSGNDGGLVCTIPPHGVPVMDLEDRRTDRLPD